LISPKYANAVRLIEDNMLLRSLEKMRCKYLIRVVDLCRRSVAQLNGGGYSPEGGQKRHIHLPEIAYLISQNC
jgi:hypothetical protein